MHRYFMNLRHRFGLNGQAVDHEGGELVEVTMVREHALEAARKTIARARLASVHDWFELGDDQGENVRTRSCRDTALDEEGWDQPGSASFQEGLLQ